MTSESDKAFFAPLWRRMALVGLLVVWFAYETLFIRDQVWLLIVGGMLVYAVWTYIIRWNRTG